jgi:hypothetical protein
MRLPQESILECKSMDILEWKIDGHIGMENLGRKIDLLPTTVINII